MEQFLGENATAYGSVIADTLGPRWCPDTVVATSWIEWCLDAVSTQVTLSEQRLRRSMAEFSVLVAGMSGDEVLLGDPKRLSRAVIPVWLAVIGGTVTRRQLARYLDVSNETLTSDLRKLCAAKYLVREGAGRASVYPGPRVESWADFDELVETAMTGGVEAVRDELACRGGTDPPSLF